MIKSARRAGLPFLRADAAFIKDFSYEQKILSAPGAAAPHPRRVTTTVRSLGSAALERNTAVSRPMGTPRCGFL